MTKFTVRNTGLRAQAIRVAGGTKTVKAGGSAEIELEQAPDDAVIAHFKLRGVTFAEAKKKKPLAPSSDAAAQTAAVEAAAALAAAEAAVTAAQDKLAAAGDDLAAKAEAETEVKAAEAALAALKA